MPSLDLLTRKLHVTATDPDGFWSATAGATGFRLPLRQLLAMIRCRPRPGARRIVIDTGAPLSVFPFDLWSGQWDWQPGRDFDELSVAGLGTRLSGVVAGGPYTARLVRARIPVELTGSNTGPPLRLDRLIVQLADPGCGPALPLLGLWGNALDGRSLHVRRTPDDDLAARLDF